MYNRRTLKEIYDLVRQNNTLPQFVINGIDYHDLINKCKNLEEVFQYNSIIGVEELIELYLSKKDPTPKEKDVIRQIVKPENFEFMMQSNSIQNKLVKLNENMEKYHDLIDKLDDIEILQYKIEEEINIKHFDMMNAENNKIEISSIIEIFNSLETTRNIQMIILTTNEQKQIFKVSTIHPISDINQILNMNTQQNTITLLYESVKTKKTQLKKAVLNFETGICGISVNSGRKNDNTILYIKQVLQNIIILKEKTDITTIAGKLHIESVNSLPYFEFYEFIMMNPLASKIFVINERNNPWCATKRFFEIQFFDPLCYVFDEFLQGNYSYSDIKISSADSKHCVVGFESKDLYLVKTMNDYFSKIIRIFYEKKTKIVNVDYQNFFFSTFLFEIKHRALDVINSENKSTTGGYSSTCPVDQQPIFITLEEIAEYENFEKEIGDIGLEDRTYYFTCMNEEFPFIKYHKAKVEVTSGNDLFPCCSKTKDTNIRNSKQDTSKVASTSGVKEYKKFSESPNSILTNFIKDAFSVQNISVRLQGTSISSRDAMNINDSAICAMLLSQAKKYYDVSTIQNVKYACLDVRRRMLELPYELFAQELYDVPRETFVRNILDPKHYIDPYLYYRALEELFEVNIIVFTSTQTRKQYPSSYQEAHEENPTIEIPRSSQYHTRFFNEDRNFVLIFKNFGSERKGLKLPACELICVSTVEGNTINSFTNSNSHLFKKLFARYDRVCEPFFIDGGFKDPEIYSTIQDWNIDELKMGPVRGQELDIHGRAALLIFDDWNVRITPAIQPLFLGKIPPTNRTIVNENGMIDNYTISNKNYERAELKEIEECLEVFRENSHEIDDEGIYVSFQGIETGLKILCKTHSYKSVNYDVVTDLIKNKNNVSVLLQLINWLWRSDVIEGELYYFEDWFNDNTEIVDEIDVKQPKSSMNNFYLPKFETNEKRLDFCENIWSSFFRDRKIILTDGLKNRILNLMNFQDKYTGFLSEDHEYGKVPMFITGLIPQENDYISYENMIFTKKEQLKHWYNFTNRQYVSHISLSNLNVINSKIYEEMSKKINPFFYISDYGKIFLVQNIHTNIEIKNCALEIAKHWKEERENLGPYNSHFSQNIENLLYVVYKMTDENIPRPLVDKTRGTDDYLMILNYKNGMYAAMLPIN